MEISQGKTDTLSQRYLCFTCDGGHAANLLGAQRVDHRALANIWIANEPHADLFLVCVQLFKKNTHHTHLSEYLWDKQVVLLCCHKEHSTNYQYDLI